MCDNISYRKRRIIKDATLAVTIIGGFYYVQYIAPFITTMTNKLVNSNGWALG
jgi:hypothetical protein